MGEVSLKEQHEIAIGNVLLRTLGCDSRFICHGTDGSEPDLIYLIAGWRVGIEIATAYYDDNQAKVEWQLARGILKGRSKGFTKIGSWIDPDKLMISRVQKEVDDKCSKTYSGIDEAWLCIEQHALLADVSETQHLVASIKIPPHHPFKHIYLGFYAHAGDGGGFRVYDLLEEG